MRGATELGHVLRLAVSMAVLALSMAGRAGAQARDAPVAEALFREGRQAADRGDHQRACQKFHESNRLDPAVGTVFNIADCEEKLQRFATAWTLFQEVVQRLPSADERHSIAKRRALALEPRIPRLTIRLAAVVPPGTTVFKDGLQLGPASLDTPLPVNPGEHTIMVKAPGRLPGLFKQRFAEGESRTVEVRPGNPAAALALPNGPHDDRGADTRLPGYVLGGIGVLGVGVGVVAGVMVIDRKNTVDDNCTAEKRCNDSGMGAVESGRTLGAVSAVGFIAGAVGLGAGAYFVLSSKHETARTAVSGRTVIGGAALAITRSW